MLCRTVTLDSRDAQPWRIYVLSDAHVGDICCDEAGLRAYIATIAADPKGRCVITGDLISAIGKGDKRLDLGTLAPWVLERRPSIQQDILGVQAERAVEWLAPIAHQIDAIVCGNHESRPRAWYGRDVMQEIARELGIKETYLGSFGWLTYQFRTTATQRRGYDIILHHGTASGSGEAPEVGFLAKMLYDHDADMAICGHSHRRGWYPPWAVTKRDAKSGKLYVHDRYGGVGGTWQMTPSEYDQWQDERRLRPRSTGGIWFDYMPTSGRVSVAA